MTLAWIMLIVAGLFEIVFAVGLKFTDGFTRLGASIGALSAMTVSVILLNLSLRSLPVGTAYAVWTGIGAVGTVVVGIVALGEPATFLRVFCVSLILFGIVGLKLVSN